MKIICLFARFYVVLITLYFCPWTELATRCVTRPLNSFLILPPMLCTRLQNAPSCSFFLKPVKQMMRFVMAVQKRGRELQGKGCWFFAQAMTTGGPKILCSSLRNVSNSSPSNGSQIKTTSTWSSIDWSSSLPCSEKVNWMSNV